MGLRYRYARLGYVSLDVTNLERSRAFYTDLVGLAAQDHANGGVLLRCSRKRCDIMLREGAKPGLSRIGFELASHADLDAAFEHLRQKGLNPAWTGQCGASATIGRAFRFAAPDTALGLEFYAGGDDDGGVFEPSVANITRLGHVVLNVADFTTAYGFWAGTLGFAVSDHVPGRIAFLRCPPNPLHHSLALIGGGSDGLNHVNFMVSDIDDIGRAIYRMKAHGVPIVFGPGRHKPSESIFLYFLDPDGMTVEYSFGMEEFAERGARAPRELAPTPDTLDMWGGKPDPAFGATGDILVSHE